MKRRWRLNRAGSAFLAFVVVAFAMQVVVWLYLFVTRTPAVAGGSTEDCHGRSLGHLPCILNLNGGVLAADAIAVALAATLLTLYLTGAQVIAQDAESRRRRERFERLLRETAYEAAHNLQHLTRAFHEGPGFDRDSAWEGADVRAFSFVPEIQLIHAPALLSEDFEDLMSSGDLRAHLDHLMRTDDFIRRFPVAFGQVPGVVQALVAYFAEHCIRVMFAASSCGPDAFGQRWAEAIERATATGGRTVPGATGAPDAAQEMQERRRVLAHLKRLIGDRHVSVWVRFYASWVNTGDPGWSERAHTVVWYDDRPGEAGSRIALWPVFARLADPPPRIPPNPGRSRSGSAA